MRRRMEPTVAVPALLAVLAAVSIWPLVEAWLSPVHALRVLAAFLMLGEFAAFMTAVSVRLCAQAGIAADLLLIVAWLFLWEIIPGAVILGLFALYVFPGALLILAAVLGLAMAAVFLVGNGNTLAGTGMLLVPVLLVAGVSFYRPWTPGSPVWPVVGALHLALAAGAVIVAVRRLRRQRRHPPSPPLPGT
jgi:hypothetical protein